MPAAGGRSKFMLDQTVIAKVTINRKITRLLPRRNQIALVEAAGISLGTKKCIMAAGNIKLTKQGAAK